MGTPEKYGKSYKEARKQKMESMPIPADEVMYSTQDLETHHNHPKMFDGPDVKENLVILCKDFHAYIHQVCNVTDNDLIYRRKHYAKKIWNEPNSLSVNNTKQKIEEIDDVLMREYIQNMIFGISDRYKQKVLEITLLSQMKTIREQAIKIRQLEDKLSYLTPSSHDRSKKK